MVHVTRMINMKLKLISILVLCAACAAATGAAAQQPATDDLQQQLQKQAQRLAELERIMQEQARLLAELRKHGTESPTPPASPVPVTPSAAHSKAAADSSGNPCVGAYE